MSPLCATIEQRQICIFRLSPDQYKWTQPKRVQYIPSIYQHLQVIDQYLRVFISEYCLHNNLFNSFEIYSTVSTTSNNV